MTRIKRMIAAPLFSAAIFGATLGMAGTAGATMTTYSDGSMVATPDVHARQDLMSYWQRGRLPEPVPQFDNTVHG